MFIIKPNDDGTIRKMELGTKARYDALVAADTSLLFFERHDVSELYSVPELMNRPDKYRVMLDKFLIRVPD